MMKDEALQTLVGNRVGAVDWEAKGDAGNGYYLHGFALDVQVDNGGLKQ